MGGAPPLALNENLGGRRGCARFRRHVVALRADDNRDVGGAGLAAAASACASIERPATSCSTFGRPERMRTPSPAARTMVRQRRATVLMGRVSGGSARESGRRGARIAVARMLKTPAGSTAGAREAKILLVETKCVSLRRKKAYTKARSRGGARRGDEISRRLWR